MGLQVFLGTFLSPDTPTTLTTCTALVVRNGVILRRCTTADEATALVAELGQIIAVWLQPLRRHHFLRQCDRDLTCQMLVTGAGIAQMDGCVRC